MMHKQRFSGITFFGWLFITLGLLYFFYYTLSLIVKPGGFILPNSFLGLSSNRDISSFVVNTVVLIYFIMLFLSGLGILRRDNFWRKSLVCLFTVPILYIAVFFHPLRTVWYYEGFSLASEVLSWEQKIFLGSRALVFDLVAIVPFLLFMYYFTHSQIKNQFR
jgi:hypothetical protein